MAFFDRIRKKMPGNPASVAKTMLRAFRIYQNMNPGCSKEDALRYAIESRYKIIKAVNQDRIAWIIERSDCLETMVFLVFCEENDLIKFIDDDPHFLIQQIENDISEFFESNAPEESMFAAED